MHTAIHMSVRLTLKAFYHRSMYLCEARTRTRTHPHLHSCLHSRMREKRELTRVRREGDRHIENSRFIPVPRLKNVSSHSTYVEIEFIKGMHGVALTLRKYVFDEENSCESRDFRAPSNFAIVTDRKATGVEGNRAAYCLVVIVVRSLSGESNTMPASFLIRARARMRAGKKRNFGKHTGEQPEKEREECALDAV